MKDQYSLEHICGGMSVFPTPEKTANMVVNLILPLCIRMGSGRRDTPKMRQQDISFALTILLHTLVPPYHLARQPSAGPGGGKGHHLPTGDIARSGSMSSNKGRTTATSGGPRDIILNIAFLGLKIIIVCFEKQLSTEWYRIAQCIKDLGGRLLGGGPLWRFLDFAVTIKTPLYMNLQPFIQYKMMKVMCETEQDYFLQQLVHQKLQGYNMPHPKCKSTVLIELATELRHLKEELLTCPIADMRPRTSTIATDRSDYSHRSGTAHIPRTTSIHDLLEQQVTARLQALMPNVPGSRKHPRASKSSISSQMTPTLMEALSKLTADTATMMSHTTYAGSGISRQATIGEGASPALRRKSSQRISAQEGSRILEKFLKRPGAQEEEGTGTGPGEAAKSRPASSSPRKLQRQPKIYQRGPQTLSKQLSVCEEESHWQGATGHSVDETQAVPLYLRALSSRLLRRACIIHRGRLKHQHAIARLPASDLGPNDLESHDLDPDPTDVDLNVAFQGTSSPKSDGAPGSPRDGSTAGVDPSDPDGRSHRLQRQDAKSRKTFKIKRHRSTIKGNIMRSSTMKGSIRCQPPKAHLAESPMGSFGNILETVEAQSEDVSDIGEMEVGTATGEMPQMEEHLPVAFRGSALGERTEDTSSMNGKAAVVGRRSQFIKSKSQDDAAAHSIHGRRRIARQGARFVRSRSPSMSPARGRSPNLSPAQSQTYVAKCDSIESLTSAENCALLKKDAQSQSQSSLLIYFDVNDVQDTCV